MAHPSLPVDQLLVILTGTPSRITALTAGLLSAQLHHPPGRGEWSANDAPAHLRSCADVWGGCIATIIKETKPTIRAINPRTWIQGTDYLDLQFQQSLRAFTRQRSALLRLLQSLHADGWSRSAVVTGAGAPLNLTVLSYAERMALHERPHVKQIGRIAGTLQSKILKGTGGGSSPRRESRQALGLNPPMDRGKLRGN
jgi:hypothetical protein